jgi:hypothetical protein
VWARLRACQEYPEQIAIEIRSNSIAIYDFASREFILYYTPEEKDSLAARHVGPLILAPFLPAFSAAMVHSSGLVYNGRAALFLAPDSGGKTTAVKNSPNGVVLCDDQIIFRKENGRYEVYGTPWGMITNANNHARIGGLFLLEQAERFELTPIKPVTAFQYFWDEHFAYHFLLPKANRKQVFELYLEVCHQAPVYRMRFPKDYIDWDAIDAAMIK